MHFDQYNMINDINNTRAVPDNIYDYILDIYYKYMKMHVCDKMDDKAVTSLCRHYDCRDENTM